MVKEIDYRIAFAVIFLIAIGGFCLVFRTLPSFYDFILIVALAGPGLVPRLYVWVALLLSGMLMALSFGVVLVSDWKAPQAYAIGFFVAAIAFLAAAQLGFSRQRKAKAMRSDSS